MSGSTITRMAGRPHGINQIGHPGPYVHGYTAMPNPVIPISIAVCREVCRVTETVLNSNDSIGL